MKKILLSLFCVITSINLMAQDHIYHQHEVYNKNITPYNDALETIQGKTGIHNIHSAEWKSFTANYPTWGAKFNTYTGLPHRAFGEPISFGSGTNFTQTAIQFMQQKLSAYNLPIADLIAQNAIADKKYVNVNFTQSHQQREILFSRATFRFAPDGKIVLFGLDLHKNIPSLNPSITATQAIDFAKNAISTTVLDAAAGNELKILPIPNGNVYAYHLVYVVTVNTQDSKEMPGTYYTLVDANTGDILYRQNKVKNISHKVKGEVHPITWSSPVVQTPLKNIEVIQIGVTYHTDANGNVTLPSATAPSTINLTGLWCKVVDDQTTTNISYNAGVLANNDSTLYDITAASTQATKVNAYYHVDKFHEFMKSKLPASFTDLDVQLLTRVDRTDGDCNAFYNGNSINFYYQGAGCASTAYLADVLYHEYGHGVTDQFWTANGTNFNNGAMGEGYSDMWAMSITDWPVIGPGFYLASSTTGIREYNAAPKVYPGDIIGEVHADGEIIAGAWWDTRINIGSLDTTSSLFAESHSGLANGPDGAEGQVYFDILIDALTYDDNDANINNGTPHFNAIVTAFAKHGIFLLSNTTITHVPALSSPALVGNAISADLLSDFPGLVGDVQVFYRLKAFGFNNPTDSLLCVNAGGGVYTATLPAAPAGSIYEYYYRIKDNQGIPVAYAPLNSRFTITSTQRNLPHLLPIGYDPVYTENFDAGNPALWSITLASDNATAGKWIVANPIASFIQGVNVQTGADHTTGTGKCAVTGNAASTTSSSGSADVDNGRTTIVTRTFDMSNMKNPAISYWRWYANSSGQNARKDFWRVMISDDGGNVWTNVERCYEPDVKWRRNVINVKSYKSNLSNITLMFIANDSATNGFIGGALLEAALDDFSIMDLSAPASINEINNLVANVFPNPATNLLQIHLPVMAKNIEAKIMDITGKQILVNNFANTNACTINTELVAEGVYFLHLEADGKKVVKKIIIDK
jgi:Zn-dependent metalloprotease